MYTRITRTNSARRWRALWLSALLLTAWPHLQAERLPIKVYTTADGLAHNDVRRIVRDSRGFLWFCTAEGLSRFDGYGFANFGTNQGLPHAFVTDLLETRGGEYWVATRGGLVRFDPKGRPVRRVIGDPEAASPAPMFTVVASDDADPRATSITVVREGRDGTIWVGTRKGLYRLANANGRRSLQPVAIGLPTDFPEQREVADVLEDRHGSLWVAAPSGLYRRWPGGNAARYTERDGLPHQYLANLLEDREGRLWAGSRQGGFFQFSTDENDRALVVRAPLTLADLPTSWVFQLLEASDRRFWIATARGLVEFLPAVDEHGRRFRAYGTNDGLTHFEITALSEDLGGNLWLGTSSAGIMKLAGRGFSSYGERDGILQVSAVFYDRAGRLCFRGSVLGDARTSVFEGAKLDLVNARQSHYHSRLGCFDGRRFEWFIPEAVMAPGWVTEHVTLQDRDGGWWLGTGQGLFRFAPSDRLLDLKTARPIAVYGTKDGLAGEQIYRLFEDRAGDVWVSSTSPSAAGLARWERNTEAVRDLAGSPGLTGLNHDWPARSFAQDDDGNVWIGFDGQLVRYRDGRFELFTAADGVPRGAIRELHVDRAGRLWFASSQGGLVRVEDPKAVRPTFVSYTTVEGLSSDNAEVITEDRDGNVYVGGGRGLDRVDPATGRVKHFGAKDGLPAGGFRAAFRDREGVLWFGLSSGLTRFAPAPEAQLTPPLVLISGLRVTGIPQPVSALGEQDMSLADLAPDQGRLQIDFVALAFESGEALRYQYQLEGAGADWSAPGEGRSVTYASLAPGRYRFLVRAVNSAGKFSASPASLRFTILRPVWQRWWFLALVAVAIGFLVNGVFRYRVARALEIANMRTRIATDLHDDIGANLTRIALLSEVARQTRDDGSLTAVARIARESVSSMSDIVWAINPRRESLLDLVRRMRQHAEEIFTLRNIHLRFDAPPTTTEVKLGMDVRRDFLLLFKEAVSNAARHSECSRVVVELRIENARLVLVVADNGVGFETSRESEGQGLASMQRRARRLEGTLDIASSPGAGTALTLGIPL